MSNPFQVGLTNDFYDAAGQLKYRDIGLSVLDSASGIAYQKLADHRPEMEPDQLVGLNGVVVLTPKVTTRSLSSSENLLALGRFGVGYDTVDVAACTAADVVLFITAGAVDYSVAEATVGWMLALGRHVRIKDQLVREARWEARSGYMGGDLRGRTLGVVGFGGIGRTLVKLLSGFAMQTPLVFDPFVSPAAIAEAGGRAASLDELLAQSDFVSLHCPLNEKTRNLISSRELSLMKPTSFLINTARGGIVDEEALYSSLESNQIAGAALDCFVGEPLLTAPKFADLDNILLAPHCIAWTHELFRDIGRMACQGMVDLTQGKRPHGVVNPEVFDRPGFQAKWQRIRG